MDVLTLTSSPAGSGVLPWVRLSRPLAALGSQDEGFSPTKRTEEPGVCAQGPRPAEEMGVGATGRGRGAGQVKPQGSAPQDARSLPGLLVWSCVFRREGRGQGAVCGRTHVRASRHPGAWRGFLRADRAPWGWGEPDCVSLHLCSQSVPSDPPGISDPSWLKALVATQCSCLPGTRGPSTAVSLILQEMGTPDHLTCLLRDLHEGQEAAVRTWNDRLVPDQERSTYIKAVCCHPAYLTYMQSTSCEMPGWVKHKLESRLPGEISVTSDMQMTPPLWQKVKKSLFMKVKEESEKADLKLNIQKTKIMVSGPVTSWQIDGEIVETVREFIFLGSKITADGDFSHKIKKHLLLGRKAMTNLHSIFKNRDINLLTKVHLVKAMVFPVVMYGCESWTLKKAE